MKDSILRRRVSFWPEEIIQNIFYNNKIPLILRAGINIINLLFIYIAGNQ
jgi:hypothetical protein